MKIIGIGVDIVDNARFKKLVKKKQFINRICSSKESKSKNVPKNKSIRYEKL